jgi:hypothetical protein
MVKRGRKAVLTGWSWINLKIAQVENAVFWATRNSEFDNLIVGFVAAFCLTT